MWVEMMLLKLLSCAIASAMREPWELKVKRIRKSSPYGILPGWSMLYYVYDQQYVVM